MTKIPSNYTPIETILINKFECTIPAPLHSAQIEAITQALTAQREAGARELVSELRKVFLEDGEDSYIQLAARIAFFIRKHETLTPPTK